MCVCVWITVTKNHFEERNALFKKRIKENEFRNEDINYV